MYAEAWHEGTRITGSGSVGVQKARQTSAWHPATGSHPPPTAAEPAPPFAGALRQGEADKISFDLETE